MATEVLNVTSEQSYWESVRKAGETLRSGGLIAFPTETVYGIGASAERPDAVARLSEVKGRPGCGPFTVHIAKRWEAARFLNETPGVARRLMARGWPGPLTLIFEVEDPASAPVSVDKDPGFVGRVYFSDAKGGNSTVGLRYPDCSVACDAISEAGCVVVASSANRTGMPPPTQADEVLKQLEGDVDLLLDAGATRYGGPSTIVQVRGHRAEIVREGVLDERTVRKLASNNILLVCTGNTCRSPMAEGLLRALLADALDCQVSELERNGYKITSAGTAAIDGAPATPEAMQAMKEKGIDISGHRSCGLTAEMIEQAQVILTMTAGHRGSIQGMDSSSSERCYLVAEHGNIEDPLGCSLDVYKSCRDQIEAGLRAHLSEVLL